MTADCIFCQIVAGKAPADIVYADEQVTAFRDINPQASIHVLIVPNEHIVSLNDATDPDLLSRLVIVSAIVARQEGVAESGYRVVTNTGPDARQSVDHLHFHILGGGLMSGRLA